MRNNKVLISDFSFWQDNDYTPFKIDFRKAYQAGLDGTILRAGQNTWIDEDFLDYCRDADAAGLPRGAYWFFDSRVSPIPQADLFADIIQMSGKFPELGIWGDYEEHYGGVYGGEKNFKLFMDQLVKRFPGRLVGVYTGPAYWRENTSMLGRIYFKKFPLWIANYKVSQPDVPSPWYANEWKIWQWTAEGHGPTFGAESEEIDLNYFNGTLEQYKAYFNIPNYQPATLPEPEEPGEKMYNCVVKSTSTPHVNIRAAKDGSSTDLGNLYPGETFQADLLETNALGQLWLHCIKPGKVGWVYAPLCEYTEVQEPAPTGLPLTLWISTKEDGSDKAKYQKVV